ncbi:MAG TPA: HAMP domain-containing sensor histidine kinase [Acetobacteraceae bacterium]
MKWLRWPQSLAARTALVLMLTLTLVQMGGLTLYAVDRMNTRRSDQVRDIAVRAMGLYRSIALLPPEQRQIVAEQVTQTDGMIVRLEATPPHDPLPPARPALQRELRCDMGPVPAPPPNLATDLYIAGGPMHQRLLIGMRLLDGSWLTLRVAMPPPRPSTSMVFVASFIMMTVVAALLVLWAVRRLTQPVVALAEAAEALGRDVNATPLPEGGPTEIAIAAAAFNTMAERIQRFVRDRTFLITAIGHDLRTPITRMRLRAEFIEDELQRRKMLADLDELEAMVRATLEFGRDVTTGEVIARFDLAELSRTVLEEIGDAWPEASKKLSYQGPDGLVVHARPRAMKRALNNLVANAVSYAGNARIVLAAPHRALRGGRVVTLLVEDDGPGIPSEELEQIFLPFRRLEESRSRETGGVGLGLSIARNILRAHGGDVTLGNHPGGGVRAIVTLPF